MNTNTKGSVLISGASIAGPALAYWLHRYGFDVTVVEKAGTLRGGGYPIDIRGTAIDVVRRMGILPQLRAAHVDSRRLTFVDEHGALVAAIDPQVLAGGVDGEDVEVRRGDLAELLYATVRDEVEFRFDDSIRTIDEIGPHVDVTFERGDRRRFDVVIGADGLHSRTRDLVFGPEERFHRYLGYCFAGFTMPNVLGLAHEGLIWNTPGRAAVFYAVRDADSVHAFLCFARPEPPFAAFRDPRAQRDLVAATFADAGWEVPRMVEAMHDADDLFFDVVSQIRMPRWSSGRVALVGDAAYAPSFLTGQGSSLALVGAYVLAGSLATEPDHASAFAAYERGVREFVELNQGLVRAGDATLFPASEQALAARNDMLRAVAAAPATNRAAARREAAHSALRLPEYA